MDAEKRNVKTPTPTPQVTIEWQEAREGVIDLYINFLNVNWGAYDVRIRVGQLMQRIDPSNASSDQANPFGRHKLVVQERAAITMAWNEAKFLARTLGELIQKYESLNGEIKDPKVP